MAALACARLVTGASALVGIGLVAWDMATASVPSLAGLALGPAVAVSLAVVFRARGLTLLGDSQDPPGPTVRWLCAAPSALLAWRGMTEAPLLSPWTALLSAILLAVLTAWVVARTLRGVATSFMAGLLAFGYAWGLLIQANARLDVRAPASVPAGVSKAWTETANRTTEHYVSLAIPSLDRRIDELRISDETHSRLSHGAVLCLLVHPGALGWRWYDVSECPLA